MLKASLCHLSIQGGMNLLQHFLKLQQEKFKDISLEINENI